MDYAYQAGTEPLPSPRKQGNEYRKIAPVWAIQLNAPFQVDTEEGLMKGNPGDYLCEGLAGELWPIKREIFERTYERVKR